MAKETLDTAKLWEKLFLFHETATIQLTAKQAKLLRNFSLTSHNHDSKLSQKIDKIVKQIQIFSLIL